MERVSYTTDYYIEEDETNEIENRQTFFFSLKKYTEMLDSNIEDSLRMLDETFKLLTDITVDDKILMEIANSGLQNKLFTLLNADIGECNLYFVLDLLSRTLYQNMFPKDIYTSKEFLDKLYEIITNDSKGDLANICFLIITHLASFKMSDFNLTEELWGLVFQMISSPNYPSRRTAINIAGKMCSVIEDESNVEHLAMCFKDSLKTEYIGNQIQIIGFLSEICERFPEIRVSLVMNGLIEQMLETMQNNTIPAEMLYDNSFKIILNVARNGSEEEISKLIEANTIPIVIEGLNILSVDSQYGVSSKDPQKDVLHLISLLLDKECAEINEAIFQFDIVGKTWELYEGSKVEFREVVCCFMFKLTTLKIPEVIDRIRELGIYEVIFYEISNHNNYYIKNSLCAISALMEMGGDYRNILLELELEDEISSVLEDVTNSSEIMEIAELIYAELQQ